MALTELTSLTQAQYRALSITAISPPPTRSQLGDPDSKIGVNLGGWVGSNVMAFTVTDAINTDSALVIDPVNTNTLDVVVTADSDPNSEVTYWTVNMGNNAINGNWGISFQVDDGSTDSGTWVFVKGKGDGNDYAV